ncbi:hypothetical protein [Streptomyces malaysiensis]|uniref:hypothetical protein n=1 Tax=Streptomyces malaysiensis TaxID=92644 RepID=UPI0036BCECC2
MSTLTRYRCPKYLRIEEEGRFEVDLRQRMATSHEVDALARSMATQTTGAKVSMARRLNKHMARCPECR